jgi:alpha-ketoglutarate-dependent taurine dioxygenase
MPTDGATLPQVAQALAALARQAEAQGYAATTLSMSRTTLVDAGSTLGPPVPVTAGSPLADIISYRGDAVPGSWRHYIAENAFPYHSDGAYHAEPPRWLILYCVESDDGAAATMLADPLSQADAADRRLLSTEPWRIHQSGARRGTRLLEWVDGRERLRWDPMVMRPFISSSAQAGGRLEALIARAPQVRHVWSAGSLLLIDNWRMLHARPPCDDRANRTLWRLLLGQAHGSG